MSLNRRNQNKERSVRQRIKLMLLALALLISSPSQASHADAIRIDQESFSLSDVNYYFIAYYQSFASENAVYLEYMLDESASLKDQVYDEETGQTWFDFFLEGGLSSMISIVRLEHAANAEGFVISDAGEAAVQDVMSVLDAFAAYLQMETDAYLTSYLGDGMTRERYESHVRRAQLVREYIAAKKEALNPSDEEITAWYEDHLREYTTVSYERYYARAAGMNETPTKAQRESAEALSRAILKQLDDGVRLQEATEDLTREQGTYLTFADAEYEAQACYSAWLFDPSRHSGDREMFDAGNGFYVMVFHSRSREETPTVRLQDLYFPLGDADGGTEEKLEASCELAEQARDVFEATDQSDGAFAALAEDKSLSDAVYVSWEDLEAGTYNSWCEKWIFDSSRKSGDVSVVYSPDGFHLFRFLGEGPAAWYVHVRDDLRDAAYEAWQGALLADTEVIKDEEKLQHAAG